MANLRDIFDRPFAGPEMRIKYEAALGRFLVAYNGLEDYIRLMVRVLCNSLGRDDLWTDHLRNDDFSRQLQNLRLLVLAEQALDDLPFDRISELNSKRNRLAHGHFDQDLFSDAFEVVSRNRRWKLTIEEIDAATTEANDIWSELGQRLSIYWSSKDEY